jgi:hypothetical protein
VPFDAVEMSYRDMRGQAGPDRRTRVGLCPVDDVGEVLPERLFRQGRGDRLGAGDNQSVELQAGKIGDVAIFGIDPPLRRL